MDVTGAEAVAAAAPTEEEDEGSSEVAPATRAKAVAKPKSKKRQVVEPVSKEALSDFLAHGLGDMEAHEAGIKELKQARAKIKAEHRKASRELKKARTKRARLDVVLAKRPTWTLMAELQKRAATSKESTGSAASTPA